MVETFYEWLKKRYGEPEANRRYVEWKAKQRNRTEDEQDTQTTL